MRLRRITIVINPTTNNNGRPGSGVELKLITVADEKFDTTGELLLVPLLMVAGGNVPP